MNTLDILRYGHDTLENSLLGIPETEWEIGGVCGVWSVKDIVAHLTSYERILEEVLNTFLGVQKTSLLEEFAAGPDFNDNQVDLRKHLSSSVILKEYREIQAEVSQLAAKIPVEKFAENGTIPWYGEEYCLNDLIVYTNYGHKREHVAQINVFRDSLSL